LRYLFIHQNFPGQYLHIVRHLLKDRANDIVFISQPNQNHIAGVRRVSYQMPKTTQDDIHPNARDYELAARRADLVAATATNLKQLGFVPDIIIGHHGWGELLNLSDIWPGVPMLGYFEFYYRLVGQDVGFDPEFPIAADRYSRIRAMNLVNLHALSLEQHGQSPTEWQRSRYPAWAREQIRLLPEGARLEICKPDAAVRKAPFAIGDFRVDPKEKLVTYVSRNLEPYRGLHVMMRALPALLARPDVKVIMVGGDDVSYGSRLVNSTWREHFQTMLAGTYDASRVLMPGQIPYDSYVRLLQRSDAHVYLTYPFVASWSLREAIACGCAVIGADVLPVAEFVTHGATGLLVPPLDHAAVARQVLDLFETPALDKRIRAGARRHAEQTLDMDGHIAAFEALIAELTGRPVSAPPAPVPAEPAAPKRASRRKSTL
jgi:glycosyltransferase involved in cell wall biosynthesis